MNGAQVNAVIDRFPDQGFGTALPDRRQLRSVAVAVAISLAAHVLLLSIVRQPQPPALPAAPTEPLTVRLRAAPVNPAEAPPMAEPARPAAEPATQAKPAPAPRTRPPRRIIAVPPAAPASEKKPFTVVDTPPAAPSPAAPTAPPTAAPHFDLDAARKAARTVANEPDPAKAGTALERLPPKPYETETRLEKAIKGAKRPDCKDGVPGGLLAPIYLAMDKKDSGCKW
jgi:hypothetical protein